MNIQTIKTDIFSSGDSLESFILKFIKTLSEQSILVVTSKIVALAQERVIENTLESMKIAIEKESDEIIQTKYAALTKKDGHWCPNAGIDESNGNGKLVLWPENPYGAAHQIRSIVKKHFNLSEIGVVITDSRIYPLRAGVTGVSLGHAGFKGLRDYRGEKDLFGREMKMSQTNIADCLASTAVIVMGEGSEQTPLALINDAPVEFTDHEIDPNALTIAAEDDLFPPFTS